MIYAFEWDESKANENLKKHKVSFQEARTVFNDPFLATYPDPDHSKIERRFLSIGFASTGKVLVVIHTDRGENIRIISCRRATKRERKAYEEGNF